MGEDTPPATLAEHLSLQEQPLTELASWAQEPCLTFDAIHLALARCMDAHPPQGLERSLHEDADTLASKWALMQYLGETELALRGLDDAFLQAFARWETVVGQQHVSESSLELDRREI